MEFEGESDPSSPQKWSDVSKKRVFLIAFFLDLPDLCKPYSGTTAKYIQTLKNTFEEYIPCNNIHYLFVKWILENRF